MAGTTIRMSQLKQVLRMLAQGEAFKSIERDTGISRTTIKRYHRLIQSRALNVAQCLLRAEPELRPLLRSPRRAGLARQQGSTRRLDYFFRQLQADHMTRQLLWEEYKRDYPEGYQYSRFCHYLQQYD